MTPDVVIESRESNGRLRVPAPFVYAVVAIAGLAISAWVGYSAAASTTNARVSVLESQVQQLRGDINEIKTDVKTLLLRKP